MSEQSEQLKTDYQRCFGTPEGKNVLRDLCSYSNAMIPMSNRDCPPHTIAYAEGMRELFWYIFSQVHDPRGEAMKEIKTAEPVVDAFQDVRKETR